MALLAAQIDLLLAGLTNKTDGGPLAGGKIFTYEAGGLVPKATYEDAARVGTHPNPIILDAYGKALAFGDGFYKFIVKDSADVVQYTWDYLNYTGGFYEADVGAVQTIKYQDEDNTVRQITSRAGVVVYKAADQNCVSAAAQVLQFDTAISDPFAEYNPATFEFTAKYAGTYLIGCEVEVSLVSAGKVIDLYTIGDLATQIHRKGESAGHDVWGLGFTTIEDLAAGNQISFGMSGNDAAWDMLGGRGVSRAMFARLF